MTSSSGSTNQLRELLRQAVEQLDNDGEGSTSHRSSCHESSGSVQNSATDRFLLRSPATITRPPCGDSSNDSESSSRPNSNGTHHSMLLRSRPPCGSSPNLSGVARSSMSFRRPTSLDDSGESSSCSTAANFWNQMSLLRKRQPIFATTSFKGGKSKKPKFATWSHMFVCLAFKNQNVIPDPLDRPMLQIAGLGEKKIQFPGDSDANGIHRQLMEEFPKLHNAGGYELMRTHDKGSKFLEIIDVPPTGYKVDYLKAIVHNARIYIRPIQRNLSLECEIDEDTSRTTNIPKEKCVFCLDEIDLFQLKSHLENCPSKSVETPTDNQIPNTGEPEYDNLMDNPGSFSPNSLTDTSLEKDDEMRSITDIAKRLHKSIDETEEFDMIVRRSSVLRDALNRMHTASFHPRKKLHVSFVGELGTDLGGLTREFFRLVKDDMTTYFENTGALKLESIALQDNTYLRLGILFGMSLPHGAGAMNVLSETVFKFICGTELADLTPTINEVADIETKQILKTIESCSDIDQLKGLATTHLDMLLTSGFTKPFTTLTMTDKEPIIRAITLHSVVLSSLGALIQFRDGIWTVQGMKDVLQNNSILMKSFFCNQKILLTADSLRAMFKDLKFSINGSNRRTAEEAAYMFFVNYLDDCEQDESPDGVKLNNVLAFFTGADSLPPIGYECVTLEFNHDSVFPTSSTCSIVLALPTVHSDYSSFKHHMQIAMTMHGGFGIM